MHNTLSWNTPTRRPVRAGNALGVALLAITSGLAVGALTFIGQRHLTGPSNALVNSASAWLLAPFLVGACTRSRALAVVAGFVGCSLQLVGYYGLAAQQGYSPGHSILFFWTICAGVGGPLFGLAGSVWRSGRPAIRGLGAATLPAAFVAEGLWTYLHVLHEGATAALWLAIGAGLAIVLARRHPGDLRWLPVTVGLGLLGQIALTGLEAHML